MAEESRTALLVLGAVVAEDDSYGRNRRTGLARGEVAREEIAFKHVQGSIGVVGVDQGPAHRNKVAYLSESPATEQGGRIGLPSRIDGHAHGRIIDPRGQYGGGVFVRGEVDLDSVEIRFGKGHRREGGADRVAHGNGVGVLAPRIAAHGHRTEELLKLAALKNTAAQLLGLILTPVVHQPAAVDIVAKKIVEVVAL